MLRYIHLYICVSFIILLTQNCCVVIATARPGSPCRAYEYQCLQGDQCIPASYQCDGETDCQDRSDEIGCGMFMHYLVESFQAILLFFIIT